MRFKVIYLYILECADSTYYTGVTNNLERRLVEHNSGINKSSYTFNKRPVQLVFYTTFTDFNSAFQFETKIKKWSHAKKKALIKNHYELLKLLAKKNFIKQNF